MAKKRLSFRNFVKMANPIQHIKHSINPFGHVKRLKALQDEYKHS